MQTVPRLRNAASTKAGQTTAMGLMPSDFSATTSFAPVIRPKTLLTAKSKATGMVMPNISGSMEGMSRSITRGGAPLLSPSFTPIPRVTNSVRTATAATKNLNVSQTTYRVRIYITWIVWT